MILINLIIELTLFHIPLPYESKCYEFEEHGKQEVKPTSQSSSSRTAEQSTEFQVLDKNGEVAKRCSSGGYVYNKEWIGLYRTKFITCMTHFDLLNQVTAAFLKRSTHYNLTLLLQKCG